MYYTLYKITNLLNNKIYIGVHRTKKLNDNYFGSGTKIKEDIKKYGKENFKKEYLQFFESENEMYDAESIIVNEDFINDENTYNIMVGGFGWNNMDIETKKEISKKAGSWQDKEKRIKILESIPLEKRKEIGKKMGDIYGGFNKFDEKDINERLEKIKDIDLTKYGWVKKVSEKLNISHTQVRRFIEKYYDGEYYRRK